MPRTMHALLIWSLAVASLVPCTTLAPLVSADDRGTSVAQPAALPPSSSVDPWRLADPAGPFFATGHGTALSAELAVVPLASRCALRRLAAQSSLVVTLQSQHVCLQI